MEHKASQDINQSYLNGFIPKDILDDLSSRFIINVPEEERKDVVRLCFQIELAHWFYLDFYCPENSFLVECGMRDFAKIIFNHIPSIKDHAGNADSILDQWREYKMAVPTYGAIMLDQNMENVLLVQSYFAKASWGFPKGKVNEEEEPDRCAVREVLEETGYDIGKLINPNEFLEHHIGEQLIRLYIVTGVAKEFEFKPQTRGEIKGFKWFSVSTLPSSRKDVNCKQAIGFRPNAFFMVIPFVRNLRKWIAGKLHKPRRSRSKTTSELQSDYETTSERLSTQNQQRQFAMQCQKGYANYLSILKDTPKSSKSSYSPPPRMLKMKSNKIIQKPNDVSSSTGKGKSQSVNFYEFSSPSWKNFRFDAKQIFSSF